VQRIQDSDTSGCLNWACLRIPANEKRALDRAEGLGSGYHEEIVYVLSPKVEEVTVRTYITDAPAVDDSLQPYSWYKELVLAGAYNSYAFKVERRAS
jgi:AIG2-like family